MTEVLSISGERMGETIGVEDMGAAATCALGQPLHLEGRFFQLLFLPLLLSMLKLPLIAFVRFMLGVGVCR